LLGHASTSYYCTVNVIVVGFDRFAYVPVMLRVYVPAGVDAVVCRVSVLVTGAPPGTLTFAGFNVHFEFVGAPVQLTATVCANFACGVSVIVDVPDDPGATLKVVGEAEMAKFGPDPLNVTV
jgi:hypothetical protein